MVTEFNGFDKGVIGKKLPADSTLNNMKKADLIELLHIAEHNHSTLAWFYKNACDNSKCHRCPLSLNYSKVINDIMEEMARRDTTDGTVKVFSGREVIEILNDLKERGTDD